MSADNGLWFAEARPDLASTAREEWTVRDENRLAVAYCGDRREDAEQIAAEHNERGYHVAALRALRDAFRECIGRAAFAEFQGSNAAVMTAEVIINAAGGDV